MVPAGMGEEDSGEKGEVSAAERWRRRWGSETGGGEEPL